VEIQDSATPFHDWNERILNECYAANAVSRILDDKGQIERIVNNYSRISFDFGPTLLSWMELNAPSVYQSLLMADWESQSRFSGHGSAIAQAYNHMILPLANRRDKETQVRWGLRDFEVRFGRPAEGMWLPETAVDVETLDLLAEYGVRFTILAPHQAKRIRRRWGDWHVADANIIDTTVPYFVELPSGRTIAVFFYNAQIAHAVAFEHLLSNGDTFANRLMQPNGFDDGKPHLVHFATDGESYGHHHRFGDMALAYALNRMESDITNYGEFLEKNPPEFQAEIVENSSWSCAHGIERWRSNCGCNSGAHADWSQAWRGPFRDALDGLRSHVADIFETKSNGLLKNPWEARNDYIQVVLNRSTDGVRQFFDFHATHPLSAEDQSLALKLLEMQRHSMLAYTSCGWFFDDLAGIETIQNMQYAARAAQLAHELTGNGAEETLLKSLEAAVSNAAGHPNGRAIYEQNVRPAMVDLPKVGAHYAVSSLFEPYGQKANLYCYLAERESHNLIESGHTRLAFGQVRITSLITREQMRLCYAMVHLGDQNISGGVHPFDPGADTAACAEGLREAFSRSDVPEVFRLLEHSFGGSLYSLRNLFRDEQRKIIRLVLSDSLSDADNLYAELFENHAPLMRYLSALAIPIPRALQVAADLAINSKLRSAFDIAPLAIDHIHGLLEQAASVGIILEGESLQYAIQRCAERLAGELYVDPLSEAKLDALLEAVQLIRGLPFRVDIWKAQNIYYEMLESVLPKAHPQSGSDAGVNRQWLDKFYNLGRLLQIHLPSL
jgi:alpha-amylase/alpha-mannosidase (GH57 family)